VKDSDIQPVIINPERIEVNQQIRVSNIGENENGSRAGENRVNVVNMENTRNINNYDNSSNRNTETRDLRTSQNNTDNGRNEHI
jgi:hypothetical protein